MMSVVLEILWRSHMLRGYPHALAILQPAARLHRSGPLVVARWFFARGVRVICQRAFFHRGHARLR